MPIFGDQAFRLQRDDWPDVRTLAMELFAIFRSTAPLQIDGPVQITRRDLQTPISIVDARDIQPDSDVFSVTINGAEVAISAGDLSTIEGASLQSGLASGVADIARQTQRGQCWPAKIITGTLTTYTTDVYTNGVLLPPRRVTAIQLAIDAGKKIMAGTWTLVSQVDTRYYMQVDSSRWENE